MNLQFLTNIKNKLHSFFGNLFPSPDNKQKPLPVVKQPTPTPIPTATPTPTPYPTISPDQVLSGFNQWSGGTTPPVATQESSLEALAALGNALRNVNSQINPFLPSALTLKESGGGATGEAPIKNNPAGILNDGNLVPYPDFSTSIQGGGPNDQLGLQGILLNSGLYDEFLKSGNLQDFFKRYTPYEEGGPNADYETQIKTLLDLLSNFSFKK